MRINVLGPLEATDTGGSLVPSAHKPRQVLALLALNNGRVVTAASLMEELWGTAPPRSAATTLQTYIMQLRRNLAAAAPARPAKEILASRAGGYLLDVAPEDVDLHAYETALAQGRAASERGDDVTASQQLEAALAVWRGDVLVDLQVGLPLGAQTARLNESRICVLEMRIEADLRLGRHRFLTSELAVLTTRHPLNESFAASAMLAYYRSGRQSCALGVYGRLRRHLVHELGVEPSGRLQRLHVRLLEADPSLEAPTVAASPLLHRANSEGWEQVGALREVLS